MINAQPIIPKGAAFFALPEIGVTRSYAFVLVPGFTLLAFSSVLEPLRIANQLSQKPLYHWHVLSEKGEPVASSSGVTVHVDGKLTPLHKDVCLLICAGNPPMAAASPAITRAVQRHHRHGGIIGGICTGTVALAKAGLLSDRRFTLHWENQVGFAEAFGDLLPSTNRHEVDDRIITCGGGVAAAEMMLKIITDDHGSDFAFMVSEMCLNWSGTDVERAQRSSLATAISTRNPVMIAAVNLMKSRLDNRLTMAELAVATGYSSRHLERLFRSVTGKTPAEFYRKLRLDHARDLLITTNLTLAEIAGACGFTSISHLSSSFKTQFGKCPSKLKMMTGLAFA